MEATAPRLALIVLVPAWTAVMSPAVPPSGKAATPGLTEFQVTLALMSDDVPSLYVPLALYCWLVPWTMLTPGPEICSDVRIAVVTVRLAAGDVTPPNVAVMFEAPIDTPLARPAALRVATAGVADVQVVCEVRTA